jgi:hypothetical protein
MATFNKFNDFVEQLGLKKMDLNADTLKVYLTNAQPVATDTVFGTPAEITAGNGYTAGGADSQNVWSESPAGTGQCVGTDIVWTAAGGTIGPFRWAVLYDDTSTAKHLIGWWEYPGGSSITLQIGETFSTDFGATMFTLA